MEKIGKILSGLFLFWPSLALAQITKPHPLTPIPWGTQLGDVVIKILVWIYMIAGFLAVIYLAYGGIIYVTAAGNPERAKLGRDAIVHALIGIAVVILAYAITYWISRMLGATLY